MSAKLTEEARKQIIDLYRSGISVQQIAQTMNIHTATVHRNVKRMGGVAKRIHERNYSAILDAHAEEIYNLVQSGETCARLAKRYEVPYGAMRIWQQKHGCWTMEVHRWTDVDFQVILDEYPTCDVKELSQRLGVSVIALEDQASLLGVEKERLTLWTVDDIELLKQAIEDLSRKDIYILFADKYTPKQISSKITQCGLSKSRLWTANEDDMLRKHYEILGAQGLELQIPHHSRNAICKRARQLGLTYCNEQHYSSEEDTYIRTHWEQESDASMAQAINRTVSSVRCQRLLLRLKRIGNRPQSYEDLFDYLRRNNYLWRYKSLKTTGRKCYISGKPAANVHHVYPFHLIAAESIKEWGHPILESIDEYEPEDLRELLDLFRVKQDTYPIGVPLTAELHIEFHRRYGTKYFTLDNWNEFLQETMPAVA